MTQSGFDKINDVLHDIIAAIQNEAEPKMIHRLINAIIDDNVPDVQLIIHQKELLNERVGGYTSLHLAAYLGRLEIVNELIKAGFDIDAFDSNNTLRTAVILAAEKNHARVVETLLSHGAFNPFQKHGEDVDHPLFNIMDLVTLREEMAQHFFKDIDLLTLFTLTQKKQYQFNPHRHVKIWLSSDSNVFMHEKNQLRLRNMRADCLDDEINLVYDSRLLSDRALLSLRIFCVAQEIIPIDVRHIITQCTETCELLLIELYEDEVSHLNEGGNLAAASDILRWLKPVFSLGTYSDLDILVCTKELPKTIPVFGELLCSVGNIIENGETAYNNNIIALLNPESEKIKRIQQFIIDACEPAIKTPKYMLNIMNELQNLCSKNNVYIARLSNTFLGASPRQWRANISNFMDCLNEWHCELIAKGEENELVQLLGSHIDNREQLSRTFYMHSVMQSTGPITIINWLDNVSMNTFSACAVSFYPLLFKAFHSLTPHEVPRLNMSATDFNNRKGGDLSWVPALRQAGNKLENALTNSAFFATKKHSRSESNNIENEPQNKIKKSR